MHGGAYINTSLHMGFLHTMSMSSSTPLCVNSPMQVLGSKPAVGRQQVDYKPDICRDYFTRNPSVPENTQMSNEQIKERIEDLVKQVKVMLRKPNDDLLHKMELIDKLERLGVNYHFEKEIDEALHVINNASVDDVEDIYMVSLRFRLLRQHRYFTTTGIFDKFKDQNGNFKETLISSDVRGLLALYEAAYLSIPGEEILEKAKDFTSRHLKSMLNLLKPSTAKLVMHALERPLHRRMRRMEARQYISFYQEDDELKNDLVLELAKLDFHLLQLLHREEIRTLSKQHVESGLGERLKFSRERTGECYFWTLVIFYEPKHSFSRLIISRLFQALTYMDDIYDTYGTKEELVLFTDIINRWDVEAANNLEDHLKLPFFELNDIIDDVEKKLRRHGKYDYTNYLKETIKEGLRMHFEETQWRDDNIVPSLEEYLRVRSITTLYLCLACIAFLCEGEAVTLDALQWLTSDPKMIYAFLAHCRLLDDLVSYEIESKREHVATAVECYMKEHKCTAETATEKLLEMVEDMWKVFNQEYVHQKHVPKALAHVLLNLTRAMETLYRGVDRYTENDELKDYIALLLEIPIAL